MKIAIVRITDFSAQFWNALEPLGFRLHWGKFLPRPDPARPHRLTDRFVDWPRWNAVRQRVDPNGVFMTRYWREHLGIDVEALGPRATTAARQPQASAGTFA